MSETPGLSHTDLPFGVGFVPSLPDLPPWPFEFYTALEADYHVTKAAFEAGLIHDWDFNTIHYNALLTVPFVDLDGRAGVRGNGYVNTLGDPIADNKAHLLSGDHDAPILTQTAQQLTGPNVPVWTGANPDGSWSGFTANGWTDWSGTATVGNLNGIGTEWISNGTQNSQFALARLYGVHIGSIDDMMVMGYAHVMTYTIPEPSTQMLAFIAGGGLTLLAFRRRTAALARHLRQHPFTESHP